MARKREKQNISKLNHKIAKHKKELHDVLNGDKTRTNGPRGWKPKCLRKKYRPWKKKDTERTAQPYQQERGCTWKQ